MVGQKKFTIGWYVLQLVGVAVHHLIVIRFLVRTKCVCDLESYKLYFKLISFEVFFKYIWGRFVPLPEMFYYGLDNV